MVNGSRRYDEIRLTALPALFDQKPPSEHDVFCDRENPLIKHGPHFVREPVVQLSTAIRFAYQLDSKSDLGKSHYADIKLLQRASGNKVHDPRFRPWPAQLGQDVGIE